MTPTDEITEDNYIATALHNTINAEDGVLVVFRNGHYGGGSVSDVNGFAEALEELSGECQVKHRFTRETVAGWIAESEEAGDWRVAVERYRAAIAD